MLNILKINNEASQVNSKIVYMRFCVMMASAASLVMTIILTRANIDTLDILSLGLCSSILAISVAQNARHTTIYTLMAIAFTLFEVRNYCKPTEGWGTAFYTESEIEVHQHIQNLEEFGAAIRILY